MVLGSNVSECSPITPAYIWRARDRGARLIVVDPRMTPIARTADLFLPVRPGRDSALANGILHVLVERGWIDAAFIDQNTVGFQDLRGLLKRYTPRVTETTTGVPARSIRRPAAL